MIPLASFIREPKKRLSVFTLFLVLGTALLVTAVSGYGYADDFEGYLGETITLHGVSYNSDQIYLFMTGPGLPANGVALTDITQRADQGQFTTVGVDSSSQQWSYKWDTLKLENQIDPGTYTVYAVNAPVDASSLTGHSYQAMKVYLKDGKLAKNRVSVGTKYTVNLADDDPVTTKTTVVTSPPTTVPTTVVPETTLTTAVPTPSPTPTKKSALLPFAVILALAVGSICVISGNRE